MFPTTCNELIRRIGEVLYLRERLDLVWRGELDPSLWNRELENLLPLPAQSRPFFHNEQAGIHILPPSQGSLYASILLKYKQIGEEDYSLQDEFKLPGKRFLYRVGKERLEKKRVVKEEKYDLRYAGQRGSNKRNERLARGEKENILVLLQTKLSFYILGIYKLDKIENQESTFFYFQRL